MEEAFKMRNLLEEFLKKHDGVRYPTILGLREHIFTGRYVLICAVYRFHNCFSYIFKILRIQGQQSACDSCSVSSLAWFMSNQETSFVTIGQRLLANPLK